MKKKILYIVNVDWFFDSHRFDLAKATKKNGFDVHILLNITSEKIVEKFKNAGFSVYPMKSQRGQHGVFSLLEHIYKYWKIMYELKPEVVHFITMKPIILGGLVSRLFNFHSVFAITGLGPAFSDGKGFIAFKRSIFKKLLKLSLCTADEVIVQNEGDKKFIRMLIGDISKTKINLIKGSGVSMQKFFS